MKPVIKIRMFLQDGSLIFKPKDVMVVRFLVFLDGDEVSGYPVFFEGFQANFSIPIGSEIGMEKFAWNPSKKTGYPLTSSPSRKTRKRTTITSFGLKMREPSCKNIRILITGFIVIWAT